MASGELVFDRLAIQLMLSGWAMKRSHEEFISLLVKQLVGEPHPEDRQPLLSHVGHCARCSSIEQELIGTWQRLESLQVGAIPSELYEKTRETILARLKRENSPLPWFEKIPRVGIWSFLLPVIAGAAMTTISYLLIRNLGNLRIHHHYVLSPLFSLWWLLFASGFWLIFNGRGGFRLRLGQISTCSILITLLTLIVSCLAYEVDSIRWLAVSASQRLAVISDSLLGIGNAFITSWWLYCCLASFVGAFIYGLHNGPAFSTEAILAAFGIAILLSPVLYLQGTAHNHSYGMIAFAAVGTYVGSLTGIGLGWVLRRQIVAHAY